MVLWIGELNRVVIGILTSELLLLSSARFFLSSFYDCLQAPHFILHISKPTFFFP